MKKICLAALLTALVSTPASAAIDLLSPSSSWSPVLVGNNFDPGQDTQAVAAVDLTGFGATPLFYMDYDDGGTPGDSSDDEVAFRFRADNAVDAKGDFSGYIWIGLDVDGDLVLDAFMMLVGKNGAYHLDVYDAGTGANVSPSTTDVDASTQTLVATGFGFNHSLIQSIDVADIADMDADGDPDYLISYKVSMDALATALNTFTLSSGGFIQDLNGGLGMTKDTPFRLVAASAQNDNALNGDIGGVNDKTDDLSLSFTELGAISGLLTFSEPVPVDSTPPAIPTVASQTTGNANPTITGTFDSTDAAGGFTVTVNGVTYTLGVDAALTATGDSWSLDLTGETALSDGTYDVTATATDGAGNSSSDATSGELVINTAAPLSPTVDSQLTTNTQPTITGTYDSANAAGGFTVTVDGVTYTLGVDPALSTSGDNWSLNLATAGQTLADGSYDVVATATDGVGNSSSDATAGELVVDTTPPVTPTVNSLVTSNPQPIISGTFDAGDMAGGSVVVNGVTYSLGHPALSVSGNNWSVNLAISGQTLTDGYHEVVATAIDAAGNSVTDTTTLEVLVDTTAPAVPTVDTLHTSNTQPTLSGGYDSSDAAGGLSVTVDGVTFVLGVDAALTTAGDSWFLNLATAGHTLAYAGYDVAVTVADALGNSSSDVTSNELLVDADSDGDGVVDADDLDDDNDGIPDTAEGSGSVDSDGDGVPDSLDLDSDNDGLLDLIESGITNAAALDLDVDGRIDGAMGANGLADVVETSADSGTINYTIADSDGDLVHDFRDLDSDNDGLFDVIEANGSDANGDGMLGDVGPVLVDVNGIPVDPILTPVDTDGDGVPDQRDLDSDNDGIPDVTESGGADGDGDGVIGTGVPTTNPLGVPTGGPLPPADSDGDGNPDHRDLDSDNDGINDIIEAGGSDDGDGMVDGFVDNDGDGFDDFIAGNTLPLPDDDGDGIPDFQDNDDRDNDGIPDSLDLDDDNDGIPDSQEGDGLVDTDGDGVPDSLDLDSDNDGIYDLTESGAANPATLDGDNDGRINGGVGANGLADAVETAADSGLTNYNGGTPVDSDLDGVADFRDLDSDNDGIPDVLENGGTDPDGDGRIGSWPLSVNADGLASGATGNTRDTDGDGTPDYLDLDADNGGEYDLVEVGGSDTDNDGRVDNYTDGNGDGWDDGSAVLDFTDANGNNVLDYLQPTGTISTGLQGVGGCTIARNAPFDPVLPGFLFLSLYVVARGGVSAMRRKGGSAK